MMLANGAGKSAIAVFLLFVASVGHMR